MDLEPIWPAPVEHLQQFIVFLNRKGLALGSIQSRMSALAFHDRIHGYKDFTSNFRIKKIIEGWSKERSHVRDSRAPISPAILEKNLAVTAYYMQAHIEDALFQVASLLTFFGLLRISEVVASGRGDASRLALQWHNIILVKDTMPI